MHHTKEKGDLANLKIAAKLSEMGLKILIPMSEHMPFDLVAYDVETKAFYRVQSKGKKINNGKVEIKLTTSYSTKRGTFSSRYKFEDFDVLAVYIPDTDEVLFISMRDLDGNANSVTFRKVPPKPGGKGGFLNNSKMFEDYKVFPKPSLTE